MNNKELMGVLLKLHQKANDYADNLSKEIGTIYADLSLKKPRFVYSELDFLYLISWLYGYYRDDAKRRFSLEYLSELISNYGGDEQKQGLNHLDTVGRLRTYLQHNISNGESDIKTRHVVEQWFLYNGNGKVDVEAWDFYLSAMLKESIKFAVRITQSLYLLERDESKEQIIFDWLSRRDRIYSDVEFDIIIRDVFFAFGQESKDVVSFRKRYVHEWKKIISTKKYNSDFKTEARRLIENSLERDGDAPPIDGNDIMGLLEIPPGPEVKRWRNRAAEIWREKKCRLEDLLSIIKIEFESEKNEK